MWRRSETPAISPKLSRFDHSPPVRASAIRRAHEAFWSTGDWGPPNYIPPDPAITEEERNNFQTFHTPRSQTYACVLPGQIIRHGVNGGQFP